MCGICGIIDNRGGSVSAGKIGSMADRMTHRGPDDAGVYVSVDSLPHVGMGHRRLSIIDLSVRGHQPMANEDDSIRIVLNGEIYNYIELKEQLEKKGHAFRSDTDTETVIHLYEEYGEDCVRLLRGMFAFAIWDGNRKMLYAARDRAGKKPLLYSYRNGRFCFASEFVSLLESGIINTGINRTAIDLYLTLGYIPAPATIYEEVLKLPPAHTLMLKDGKLTVKRYWELDYSRKLPLSEQDAAAAVFDALKESVSVRMRSDVPLGAFLSGGIDSSAVVAMMSNISGRRVKTFSIGFEEKDYDELDHARRVAGYFGTEHRELIVKADALSVLPLLVERYGEPYADSSAIPTYYVCKETRRFVTVALNGDGGDELFAGYERYQAMLISERYRKMPRIIRDAAAAAARAMPDSVDPKNKFRRIKRFFNGAELPLVERYIRWIGIFSEDAKDGIYSDDFRVGISRRGAHDYIGSYMAGTDAGNLVDKLLETDTYTYLPNDLLVKVDIASMANSLEARSPFLDHKLMELASALPAEYKLHHLIKKYILKKSLGAILPAENVHRRKMGFGLPVGRWFRNDLKSFLTETLLSSPALKRGYFRDGAVKKMIDLHVSGKNDFSFQLWSLLMLELWHRRFVS